MKEIVQRLTKVADKLDAMGKNRTAGLIDSAVQNILGIKTAQYLGIQGYWLRNTRCWTNCYRQKRASSPDMPAQQVWSDCQSEYLESINDDDNKWAKYAGNDVPLVKFASNSKAASAIEKEKIFFHKTAARRIQDGWNVGDAITETLDDGVTRYFSAIIAQADKLADIAQNLQKNGNTELARSVAVAARDLVKESQARQWLRNLWDKKYDTQATKSVNQIIMNLVNAGDAAGNEAKQIFGQQRNNPEQAKREIIQNVIPGFEQNVMNARQELRTLQGQGGVTQQVSSLISQTEQALDKWTQDRWNQNRTIQSLFALRMYMQQPSMAASIPATEPSQQATTPEAAQEAAPEAAIEQQAPVDMTQQMIDELTKIYQNVGGSQRGGITNVINMLQEQQRQEQQKDQLVYKDYPRGPAAVNPEYRDVAAKSKWEIKTAKKRTKI